jgi:DNA-binding NarL/FixJ family response regulator
LSQIVYRVVSVLQEQKGYYYISPFGKAITFHQKNFMSDTRTSGKILLIVDNSSLIIERLTSILKEVETVEKIFAATDYAGAVNMLEKEKADIALLDIQLPGKNGIELLKYIVKHHPGTRAVMLSNLVSDSYQRLCKEIGAVKFIDKSKDFDLIPEVVTAL